MGDAKTPEEREEREGEGRKRRPFHGETTVEKKEDTKNFILKKL
jgi:hypothetical protein